MLSELEHLEDLLRHKDKVKDAAVLLSKKLIKQGRTELARQLISRGYSHDNSKLENNVEWRSLHVGPDVPEGLLNTAIHHHQKCNPHHPEWHGGLQNMKEIDVYEMIIDFLARSQEFATDLRTWITTKANVRFHIDDCPIQKQWIEEAVNLLLEDHFRRD